MALFVCVLLQDSKKALNFGSPALIRPKIERYDVTETLSLNIFLTVFFKVKYKRQIDAEYYSASAFF